MKRLVVGIVAVAVVAIGAFFGWRYHVAHRVVPPRFTTVAVTRKNIVGKVTATGTLAATVTVTVGTQVSGRVDKLFADFNSQVKKGQLIAKIDPLLFQAAVQQSQANFLQAQAAVEQAKANQAQADRQYTRELALLKNSLAAQQDVDTAQTASAVAKAGVDSSAASLAQAAASLNQAKVNLSYTDIISPIDGVVISRAVDVGQTVAASMSAPTLFTIGQDLRKMQVNTNVAEGDVGRLEQGMPVTFTVDAYPGEKFKGTLSQIRNAATTVSNVVTYDALIDVDNSALKLRPGMTANATIISAEQDNVLAVPNAALRFKPADGMITADSSSPAGSSSGRHRGGNANAAGSASGDGAGAPAGSGNGGAGGGGDGSGGGGSRHGDGGISPDGGLAAKIAAAAGDAGVDFSTKAVIEAASRKTVYVVTDNQAHAVSVMVGLTDGSFTEIIAGGLKEGDLVATDATDATTAAAPATTTQTASPLTGGGGGGGGKKGAGGGGRPGGP